MSKPIVMERGVKYRDADKMALIPVKNVATEREALLRKPEWMKINFRLTRPVSRGSRQRCVRTACTPCAKKPLALTSRNV